MAYNEELAARLRHALQDFPDVVEKKMFGGIAFLLAGNMSVGVHKDELIVRLGAEGGEQALQEAHTRPFDITGRAMSGWVMVAPDGCASDADLRKWVNRGTAFARTLPPK
jgi:hypothetical protein